MPWKPKRPCRYPGCPELTEQGWCSAHASIIRASSTEKRLYGQLHRKWRRVVLSRFPICRECEFEEATVADHVVPIQVLNQEIAEHLVRSRLGDLAVRELQEADSYRSWLRFSLRNGQGLCHGCHNRKTRIDEKEIPLISG